MGQDSNAPLAYRMTPLTLAEFVGQRHLLSEGKMLRRMIESDRLSSLIFFGPPGVGKTSLARVIAQSTQMDFRKLNAVTSGVKDIKAMIADSQNPLLCPGGRLLLFIDEIHRFNKAQQDALLPSVEEGRIILIGATTENPYFEVNKALISRSTVFQLLPLEEEEIHQVIQQALACPDRGFGRMDIQLEAGVLTHLARYSAGDARVALNGLELAVLTKPLEADGRLIIDVPTIQDCMQERRPVYDKAGESHYDLISALIKSMRGSDPQATVYYLARMLAGGEDPKFLARRIVICAAEDVGLANPQVLSVAVAAFHAVHWIGMPEARIILSEAALLVASSPKSNSAYLAIDAALDEVKKGGLGEVPMHLRNAPMAGMKDLGYGTAYLYPHDYEGHIVAQSYLPLGKEAKQFYHPGKLAYEQKIQQYLEETKRQLAKRKGPKKGLPE